MHATYTTVTACYKPKTYRKVIFGDSGEVASIAHISAGCIDTACAVLSCFQVTR